MGIAATDTKDVVWVKYMPKDGPETIMKLRGDTFEILAAIEARLFPKQEEREGR